MIYELAGLVSLNCRMNSAVRSGSVFLFLFFLFSSGRAYVSSHGFPAICASSTTVFMYVRIKM